MSQALFSEYPEIPWHIQNLSQAKELDFKWPGEARMAVLIHTAFEAWSEIQHDAINHFRASQSDSPARGWLPNGATASFDYTTATEHDYGGRTGIWRVLELYRKYGIKGTFAVNGLCTVFYPEAVKAIAADGHEIAAHAWAQDIRHSVLTPELQRADIRRSVEAIEKLTGTRPVGWISPGGGSTEHTSRFLVEEGFIWHGDPKNSDVPYPIEIDGKILMIVGSRRGKTGVNMTEIIKGGQARDQYQKFVDEFDASYEESAIRPRMIVAVLHAELQTAGNTRVVEDMIKYAKQFPGVYFTTRGDVTRHLQQYL